MDDLRFMAEEAAAFLNQGFGLTLNAKMIAALKVRTEGWIAGATIRFDDIPSGWERGGHYLWAYSLVAVDAERKKVEVIPVREAGIHWNVLSWLEQGPCTDCLRLTNIRPSGDGTGRTASTRRHAGRRSRSRARRPPCRPARRPGGRAARLAHLARPRIGNQKHTAWE